MDRKLEVLLYEASRTRSLGLSNHQLDRIYHDFMNEADVERKRLRRKYPGQLPAGAMQELRRKSWNYVFEQWLEMGKLRGLALMTICLHYSPSGIASEAYINNDWISRLSEAILDTGDRPLWKALWHNFMLNRIHVMQDFAARAPAYETQDASAFTAASLIINRHDMCAQRIQQFKKAALWAATEYAAMLQAENDPETARIQAIIADIRAYTPPKTPATRPEPAPQPDKRRMTRALFWELIERARRNAPSAATTADRLERELLRFSPPDIRRFHREMKACVRSLRTEKLLAVATLLGAGADTQSFLAFRGWLIAQGQDAFRAAVLDAIAFAEAYDFAPGRKQDDLQCESVLYVAERAYAEKKDEFLPDAEFNERPLKLRWPPKKLPSTYPELYKKLKTARR